jgi:DNA repair exonuclease SbcCD ATPase subunit
MRLLAACIAGGVFLAPLAEAQVTTAPPSAAPPTGAPPSSSGRSDSGVGFGLSIDLGALFSGSKGPCDKFVTQAGDGEKLLAKNDCAAAERKVEDAKAELEKIKARIGEERVGRDRLRASARQAAAKYQAAQAQVAAAQAQVAAAQQALNNAQGQINAYLRGLWNNPPDWFPTGGGKGMIGISTGPGVTVWFFDDPGVWTPTRLDAAKARVNQALAQSKQATAAQKAAAQAQQALNEAQARLAAAEAAAAAAGTEYEAADAAISGLPPVDLGLEPAEKRLEAALAALEDCRKKQADLARKLQEAQLALEECEKRIALENRAKAAADAISRDADAAQEELNRLKKDLASARNNVNGMPAGPARDAARAEADRIGGEIKNIEAGLKGARNTGKAATASGQSNAELEKTAAAAESSAGEGTDSLEKRTRDAQGDIAKLEDAATRAKAEAAAKAQAAGEAQKRLDQAREDFGEIADQFAEETAKGALSELDQRFAALFTILDGVNTVQDISDNRRALLIAFARFLRAVLAAEDRKGLATDIECKVMGEMLMLEIARLTGSDATKGLAAMTHVGFQVCEVFRKSARDPAIRDRMRRFIAAAGRL